MRRFALGALLVTLFLGAASAQSMKYKFPDYKKDPKPMVIQGPAGEIFTFTRVGATTCGKFTIADSVIPPGAGPMPHIHHWTDEWFYFPDGGITIYMSEKTYPDLKQVPGKQLPKGKVHKYRTQPGDLIYGPRYYIHGFNNEAKDNRRLIFVWTPDKISEYFKEVGQLVTDPKNPPPIADKNKQLFVSQGPKYGINQSASWGEYVDGPGDYTMKPADNHAKELEALFATDAKRNGGACK
ncbi:MAG TPA: cupin domain-containing protein [Terriglobales bacterium]|nr:cupin domain-containing protein [Terriglobales bacterium]